MLRLYSVLVLVCCSIAVSSQTPQIDSPAIEARVDSMMVKLTLADKLRMLGGDRGFYIGAVPAIGLPALKMSDGTFGVRTFGRSTGYAAGTSLAAAWSLELAERVGKSMGRDARARGVHFLLAPGVNIYRSPLNGRNFEYFGEDPYLAAQTAVGFIEGVQSQGVVATVKHFAANNAEYDRHNLNSIVDERALREIYLPAFEASVETAHVGAVMDGYNLLNGVHMTENTRMNTDILKREWRFDGILMSDWGSTYDGGHAAASGLDLEMPSGYRMNPETLKAALKKGDITEANIDDKVRRILRTAVRFGFLDRPQLDTGLSQYDTGGSQVAYEAARASIILLKNDKNILPLHRQEVHTLAVIGPNLDPPIYGGGGSSLAHPFRIDDLVEGLSSRLGASTKVLYARGILPLQEVFKQTSFDRLTMETYRNANCTGTPSSILPAKLINDYRTFDYDYVHFPPSTEPRCIRWTGSLVPQQDGTYIVLAAADLRDAYTVTVNGHAVLDQAKAEDQGPNYTRFELKSGVQADVEVVYHPETDISRLGVGIIAVDKLISPEAREIAAKSDAVVVTAGFGPDSEGESHDRPYQLPYGQVELIRAVASANPRTIVAITSGGSYETETWLPQVPGLLQTWYPGQEGGPAIADILLGHSPEGRLPISFERRIEDTPTYHNYHVAAGSNSEAGVEYKEGIFLGYRYYTTMHTDVLFPFGFGLSYSTFHFGNLSVTPKECTTRCSVSISYDVTNTGDREAAVVSQVYVGAAVPRVARPIRELKGFQKSVLRPEETRRITQKLDPRAFSRYDSAAGQWQLDSGEYRIQVGNSSVDLPLTASVILHE